MVLLCNKAQIFWRKPKIPTIDMPRGFGAYASLIGGNVNFKCWFYSQEIHLLFVCPESHAKTRHVFIFWIRHPRIPIPPWSVRHQADFSIGSIVKRTAPRNCSFHPANGITRPNTCVGKTTVAHQNLLIEIALPTPWDFSLDISLNILRFEDYFCDFVV